MSDEELKEYLIDCVLNDEGSSELINNINHLFEQANRGILMEQENERLQEKIKRYDNFLKDSFKHWDEIGTGLIRGEYVSTDIEDFLSDEAALEELK